MSLRPHASGVNTFARVGPDQAVSVGPTRVDIPSRDALLRAAIKVTARGGLRALTYRAVAEEAGVVRGLVRFHFGSRDALIMATRAVRRAVVHDRS